MLKDVLDAYIDRDAEKALDVWQRDQDVDDALQPACSASC